MRELIRERKSNVAYSLHDSMVKEIKYYNKVLTFKLFKYVGNEEKTYKGEVCFKNCDLDFCIVLIFNKTLTRGHFRGNYLYLEEFVDKYKDAEFQIITEGYSEYKTSYTGMLWFKDKDPVSCIMYIWNDGDISYRLFEEI